MKGTASEPGQNRSNTYGNHAKGRRQVCLLKRGSTVYCSDLKEVSVSSFESVIYSFLKAAFNLVLVVKIN